MPTTKTTAYPQQPSKQPYSPWNPRKPSKANGEALGDIFDDHIEENYDLFTKKSDASFSTLGKYHVEMGKKPSLYVISSLEITLR